MSWKVCLFPLASLVVVSLVCVFFFIVARRMWWHFNLSSYASAPLLAVFFLSSLITTDAKSALFCNKKIDRALSPDAIRTVLDFAFNQGYGFWQDNNKTNCTISWKSFATWGDMLFRFADSTGQLGTVFTLYELSEGDEMKKQEFYGVSPSVLLQACKTLVSSGKATLLAGESASDTGVKFHHPWAPASPDWVRVSSKAISNSATNCSDFSSISR